MKNSIQALHFSPWRFRQVSFSKWTHLSACYCKDW